LEAVKVLVNSANRAERVQTLYTVTKEKLAILDLRGLWVEKLIEQYKVALNIREKSEKP
jgi:hypothetical protein